MCLLASLIWKCGDFASLWIWGLRPLASAMFRPICQGLAHFLLLCCATMHFTSNIRGWQHSAAVWERSPKVRAVSQKTQMKSWLRFTEMNKTLSSFSFRIICFLWNSLVLLWPLSLTQLQEALFWQAQGGRTLLQSLHPVLDAEGWIRISCGNPVTK